MNVNKEICQNVSINDANTRTGDALPHCTMENLAAHLYIVQVDNIRILHSETSLLCIAFVQQWIIEGLTVPRVVMTPMTHHLRYLFYPETICVWVGVRYNWLVTKTDNEN